MLVLSASREIGTSAATGGAEEGTGTGLYTEVGTVVGTGVLVGAGVCVGTGLLVGTGVLVGAGLLVGTGVLVGAGGLEALPFQTCWQAAMPCCTPALIAELSEGSCGLV